MTRTEPHRLVKISLVLTFISLIGISMIGLAGCGGVNASGPGGGGGGNTASQAIIAFGVTPGNIIAGQSATLSWNVTNAASFTISPSVGTGTLPMSGSVSVSPT